MRKVFVFAAMLMLAAFVSCSENNDVIPEVKTYEVSIIASKSGDGEPCDFFNFGTRALTSSITDGKEVLKGEWKAGETVGVYQQAKSEEDIQKNGAIMWKVGTLTAQSSGETSELRGTLTGSFTQGEMLMLDYQFSNDLVYDYTGQDGKLETIAEKYDYCGSYLRIVSVSSNSLEFSQVYPFRGYQAIVKFVLTDPEGAPLKPTRLTLSTSGESNFTLKFEPLKLDPSKFPDKPTPDNNPYADCVTSGDLVVNLSGDSNEVYVALAAGVLGPINVANLTLKAVVGSDSFTYTKEKLTCVPNYFYVFNVKMAKE